MTDLEGVDDRKGRMVGIEILKQVDVLTAAVWCVHSRTR
jgi:hypothetical protein